MRVAGIPVKRAPHHTIDRREPGAVCPERRWARVTFMELALRTMLHSVETGDFDAQPVSLGRLRAGDHEEFERTVRRLWRDAMIVVLGSGVPRHDSDAVVNAVFVALYETIRRGKGPVSEALPDWQRYVRRSAHHAAVDYWRQARRTGRVVSLEDLFDESGWEDRVAGRADTPAETTRIERMEEDAALADCMSRLDRRAASLCALIFVDGLSKRAAGNILGIPESSVRSIVVDALGTLRICLEGKNMAPPPADRPGGSRSTSS